MNSGEAVEKVRRGAEAEVLRRLKSALVRFEHLEGYIGDVRRSAVGVEDNPGNVSLVVERCKALLGCLQKVVDDVSTFVYTANAKSDIAAILSLLDREAEEAEEASSMTPERKELIAKGYPAPPLPLENTPRTGVTMYSSTYAEVKKIGNKVDLHDADVIKIIVDHYLEWKASLRNDTIMGLAVAHSFDEKGKAVTEEIRVEIPRDPQKQSQKRGIT